MEKNRRDFIRTGALAAAALGLSSFTESSSFIPSPVAVLRPGILKPGDTVAVTSPAGAVWDEKRNQEFIEILQGLGLKIKPGKTLTEKYGYLAGKDVLRAKELNDFFADKEVKAIFTAKGGWGCARILPLLDYETIRKNPKIIMGFSDITSLLVALYARTGLITFHGPVGNSSWGEFSMKYVKELLFQNKRSRFVPGTGVTDKPVTIMAGTARGTLMGGNLSVLSGIIGSEYLPVWDGAILFLEDTDEEPFRLDRMLTQLKLAGVLNKISGFIFGKCSACVAEEPEKAFTFEEVLKQHIEPLKIPAFYNAMIGHVVDKFTLPIGATVEMDAGRGVFYLTESALAN